MSEYRKKLIEVALPLEAINEASAREKSIRHGHPSTLHLWWARRPLAACRAVIFASLVDDPDDPQAPEKFVEVCGSLPKGKNAIEDDTPRQRLFDFIERLVTWEATTDQKLLSTARELIRLSNEVSIPPLLDPFSGGGSIPLEAQRLGLDVFASDLNPVAVMINKALIEVPPKFSGMSPINPDTMGSTGVEAAWQGASGLAADVEYYGKLINKLAYEEIGKYYPDYDGQKVIAWLWARTVHCPNPACGAEMPLISSFKLRSRKGEQTWVEPIVNTEDRSVDFEIRQGRGEVPEPPKVGRGAKFRCLVCDEVSPDQYIKDEGVAGRISHRLMAVITEGENGRSYHPPSKQHEEAAMSTNPNWIPDGELADDPRAIWCKLYGLTELSDLFTSRQLTALDAFSDLLEEIKPRIIKDAISAGFAECVASDVEGEIAADEYASAIITYLAFAINRSANYWSSLTFWAGFIVQTFGRQALPMIWDFSEANPFSSSSGNWLGAIDWIVRVLKKLPRDASQGVAYQADAMSQIEGERIIVTDPPYYDNIGYADLSDFFYSWMRRNLGSQYPDIFSTLLTPKSSELVAIPHRFDGDSDSAKEFFEEGLLETFSRIRESVPEMYPFSLFYAFKQSEVILDEGVASTGWETMLGSLVSAGFRIIGTWPMRTERDQGLKTGTNVLASSIVLVCRPREADAPIVSRTDFIEGLRNRVPAALDQLQTGNIAPVDLAQAIIGPGMSVYSQWAKVLEPNGERLTIRTALQLINEELDSYLAEHEGYLDEDTRFAVAWFEQYGFKEGPFGQADVLARAKNSSVEKLSNDGLLTSGAGKVKLYQWTEYDLAADLETAADSPVWYATHQLIALLNRSGEEGVAEFLSIMPASLAADSRKLAYRLFGICDRNGWSEHARDYNALVQSWGASQEQATQLRETPEQTRFL